MKRLNMSFMGYIEQPRFNYFWYLLVFSLSIVWAITTIQVRPPFEDCAMLLRYCQHIANGNGIVWNVGEAPVDGATDFLYLIVVALLNHWGLPIEFAAKVIGFLFFELMVLITFDILVRFSKINIFTSFIFVSSIIFGPGTKYIEACFGTTFFVFWCVLLVWLLLYGVNSNHNFLSLAYGLAWLGLGLARPEGVILGGCILISFFIFIPSARSKLNYIYCLMPMLILGSIYFFWHWHNFKAPLPNPFYKKGGWHLHWRALFSSVYGFIAMALPMLFIIGVASFSLISKHKFNFNGYVEISGFDLVLIIPSAIFLSIWILLSNEMNYLYRFQYVLFPIAIIQAAFFWKFINLRMTKFILLVFVLLYSEFLAARNIFEKRGGDGRADLGQRLSMLSHEHRMAVTEAGLLPFYSQWQALDMWGLNDPTIAHRGYLISSDLVKFQPDLIMLHVPGMHGSFAWAQMVDTAEIFALKNKYFRAAVYGKDSDDVHIYYIRKGIRDFDVIKGDIVDHPYAWPDGMPANRFY